MRAGFFSVNFSSAVHDDVQLLFTRGTTPLQTRLTLEQEIKLFCSGWDDVFLEPVRDITPSVVMKWTGHSDYKSMKPYIDIVDSIKASEMSKMNFMD